MAGLSPSWATTRGIHRDCLRNKFLCWTFYGHECKHPTIYKIHDSRILNIASLYKRLLLAVLDENIADLTCVCPEIKMKQERHLHNINES